MKSLVFYNVYVINNWKQVSIELLDSANCDTLVVNINYDLRYFYRALHGYQFFKSRYKAAKVFLTPNNAALGESTGLKKLIAHLGLNDYDILTYCHSKGVTKPDNENETDWRNLMRYFVLERSDLIERFFCEGYKMYGVNLCQYSESMGPRKYAYKFSDFWFRGTFVAVNLKILREKMCSEPVDSDFYGVEGYWGKLCRYEEVYCPHNSGVNHYENPYPARMYQAK